MCFVIPEFAHNTQCHLQRLPPKLVRYYAGPSHVQHEKHGIEFIGPPPAQAAYTDNHVAYYYTNAKRLGMYTTTGMLS